MPAKTVQKARSRKSGNAMPVDDATTDAIQALMDCQRRPCKAELSKLQQMTFTVVRNAKDMAGKPFLKKLHGLHAKSGLAECAARHCKAQQDRLAEISARVNKIKV